MQLKFHYQEQVAESQKNLTVIGNITQTTQTSEKRNVKCFSLGEGEAHQSKRHCLLLQLCTLREQLQLQI